MSRIYRIKGTFWKQDVPLYPELEKLKPVLGDMRSLFDTTDKTIFDIIGGIIEQRTARHVIAVVLKPWEPIAPIRWWNKHQLKKQNFSGEIIDLMGIPQIARVLYDFFTLNTEWMASLLPSHLSSTSFFQTVMQTIQSVQTKPFSPSPTTTSNEQSDTPGVPR
jgi:hypothetical protein